MESIFKSIIFTIAWLCCSVHAQEIADTIYTGGPILTMSDASPTAEGVAVKDGRIIAFGKLDDVSAHRDEDTRIFNLEGRTLIPGFIDSHGHVVMGGLQALSANLLAPPDGAVSNIAGLQATLSNWAEDNTGAVEKVNLIIGFGYDNAQLAELRHLGDELFILHRLQRILIGKARDEQAQKIILAERVAR